MGHAARCSASGARAAPGYCWGMQGTGAGGRGAWDEAGFVVLHAAAPSEAIERLDGELEAAHDRLLVRVPGDDHPSLPSRAGGRAHAGAVDPYVVCPAAREVLLARGVVAFLRDVLGQPPMLIDAVEATAGAPDPGPFRDATYVPLSDPEALVGIAVATGDARLRVHRGSHRLPVLRFSGRYRHVNPERDGEHALDEHRAALRELLDAHDVAEDQLELSPGDVVLWRAELVHRAVEGPALAGHLAPRSAEPWWFGHRPDRAVRVPHGGAWFTSRHYSLADLPGAEPHDAASPPAPPAGAAHEPPAVDVVEHELERHDGVATTPRPPQRNRGLMGRMREAMGRRPPQS